MVQSRISKKINYPETQVVDNDDLGYDATQYEIELTPELNVMIALGNTRYTYVTDDVLYIPVYLVARGRVISQIGIYEFPAADYMRFFDADGDFDISELDNPLPLLYKFATPAHIRQLQKGEGGDEEEGDEEEGDEEEGDEEEGDEEEGDEEEEKEGGDEEGSQTKSGDEQEQGEEGSKPKKGHAPEHPLRLADDQIESANADYEITLMNEDMEERQKYKESYGDNWVKKIYEKSTLYDCRQ